MAPSRAPVILTLNAGSGSLKRALFRDAGPAVLRGLVEGLGRGATISLHGSQAPQLDLPNLAGLPYDAVLAALSDGRSTRDHHGLLPWTGW